MKHNFIDKNRCRSCQHGCPLLALLLPPQPRMWRLLPPPPRLRCAINLCSHPGSQRAGASGCNCAPGHSTAASAALLLLCCCCCSTAACTPAAAPCCPLPPPAAAWTWPPPRPRCPPPPPPPHRPAIRGGSAKACQLAVVDARPSKGSSVCRCIAQRSSAQQHAWAQAACIGACRAAHPQKTIPSLAMQCKGSRSTAGQLAASYQTLDEGYAPHRPRRHRRHPHPHHPHRPSTEKVSRSGRLGYQQKEMKGGMAQAGSRRVAGIASGHAKAAAATA